MNDDTTKKLNKVVHMNEWEFSDHLAVRQESRRAPEPNPDAEADALTEASL
ncbi:MAG: hypothetical protein M2R45_00299 [Verrucomicrobia subdivision 3 bacterium]|nr:hypothetical protein [Limisphaerales bacterium]MCS1412941.1 hypothetical protein [Limisphaerales bacterium]